jgi:hypothetical protein
MDTNGIVRKMYRTLLSFNPEYFFYLYELSKQT